MLSTEQISSSTTPSSSQTSAFRTSYTRSTKLKSKKLTTTSGPATTTEKETSEKDITVLFVKENDHVAESEKNLNSELDREDYDHSDLLTQEKLNGSDNNIFDMLFMTTKSLAKARTKTVTKSTSSKYLNGLLDAFATVETDQMKCAMSLSPNEEYNALENELVYLTCESMYGQDYIGSITYKCKSDGKFYIENSDCLNSKTKWLDQLNYDVC